MCDLTGRILSGARSTDTRVDLEKRVVRRNRPGPTPYPRNPPRHCCQTMPMLRRSKRIS
ncbi:hypothetical protein LDO31_10125 [Luteimonas sp. XNQY3]|nr:hypothetical protein [Luteimonas sp. XNQY3]MCD9006585.1 hypothetical protein [Luteimonas sp. XNQY3]